MRGPSATDRVRAELLKIWTTPATWAALAVTLAAHVLLGWIAGGTELRIAGTSGAVPLGQSGALMLAPVYVFAAVGVFAAGTEFAGGQLRTSLLAVPGRAALFAAKLTATALVCTVAAVVVVAPGYVLQHRVALADGRLPWSDVAAGIGSRVAVHVLLAVVGLGVAWLARSVVVPMIVLVVVGLLAAPTLRDSVPAVVARLPHDAALSAVGTPAGPEALTRTAGLAALALWGAVLAAAAWAALARRDA
ncbi:hypothetical protein Xcel_0098 [Xylanimonas cellulosilytica DSM 15894]|uniref:Uncharacterized protein n=1 Tax=Xylanimonas cellulosilytica (strain DSM 15894 / JCM 12276 / CECT 5975 / KCTC 9989 / LMG 20990 / NBRC 107835 / XIL07) TaxID=446471 RepID=D1BTX5_XYLCX|nr:ABC transporter permease [Xylanimonas cellulosilytica]ACZ29139.1 hypothetical protein Xcel_0098 [Xylanimonas cellulosilytica DSM 15894]